MKDGIYNTSLTFKDDAGNIVTASGPLTVTFTEAVTIPPIPALDVWKSKMLTLAAKWQPQALAALSFGLESQVWYYDGGRVYQQIADYTGDLSWLTAADSILTQYANLIITAQGGIPGYRVFGKGLAMGWKRTGNPLYAEAVRQLAYGAKSPAAPGLGTELRYFRKHGTGTKADTYPFTGSLYAGYEPWYIREASYYGVGALIASEQVTGVRHPLLLCGVFDCVIPDLLAFMDSANGYDATTNPKGTYLGSGVSSTLSFVNNFMVGLALEALIDYYELTADALIPPIIKTVMDFFWAHCVEQSSAAQFYNSDPINGKDAKSGVIYTTSSLNQLVSPAFAWYWKFSKDSAYQVQGDALFAAGVLGAGKNCALSVTDQDYSYMGKQFSQNYKWGFDYVKWRS